MIYVRARARVGLGLKFNLFPQISGEIADQLAYQGFTFMISIYRLLFV